MKTKRACLILSVVILCSGCAGTQKTLDPNYQAYQQAMMNQRPLVSIEWSEDGSRIKKLDVNPQVNIQQKQPDAPHPAWTVTNSLVRAFGVVGGIWAGGQAIEGIVEAGRGTTVIDSSYNTAGSNMASGGSVTIPTEITTTTETITNPVPEISTSE